MKRRSGAVRALIVVIPVRDEAERLGACLEALSVAVDRVGTHRGAGWPPPRVRTIAVLDRCVDESPRIVASSSWVEPVISTAGRVGAARALGVRRALAGEILPRGQIWIATTDSDSRVPADWLTHQLDLAAAGADLFRGLVEPDSRECGDAAYDVWRRAYRRQEGHPHVHGASLGVRADAYEMCGGFDPLASVDEDVALVRAAEVHALSVVASTQAIVATSGRLLGRVSANGFASYLSNACPAAELAR